MRETPSLCAVPCVVDVARPLVPTSPKDDSERGNRLRRDWEDTKMKKKQLAELVRKIKEARDASQTKVATALRSDDRLMVEYYRGGLDACRDVLQLIEAITNG